MIFSTPDGHRPIGQETSAGADRTQSARKDSGWFFDNPIVEGMTNRVLLRANRTQFLPGADRTQFRSRDEAGGDLDTIPSAARRRSKPMGAWGTWDTV